RSTRVRSVLTYAANYPRAIPRFGTNPSLASRRGYPGGPYRPIRRELDPVPRPRTVRRRAVRYRQRPALVRRAADRFRLPRLALAADRRGQRRKPRRTG